jgi:AAA domain
MPLFHTYEPEEVFTPRNHEVNEKMYVDRPELEFALENALKGGKHIVVHGESGTGKSWLYKRVFAKTGTYYEVANLANASRLGSITKEIENVVNRTGQATVTGYKEGKSAKASVAVAEGQLTHEKEYEVGRQEPFEECLTLIRSRAGRPKRAAILVLDNLETIFGRRKLMTELADIIILLDDERYASHAVKLLVVGVPHRVREYFNETPNRATVANRLHEIPEVSRLSDKSAQILVYRGFVNMLKYAFAEHAQRDVINHIAWVTDRIPQRLHEYCLELAYHAKRNGRIVSTALIDSVDRAWLASDQSHAYSVVENAMNERETRVGRRNQTIFALGCLRQNEFRIGEVEDIVRSEFPRSTVDKRLDISGMLSQLASGSGRLIKRSPKGDSYMFADPRYRMCIRAMLRKRGEEIVKIQLES